MSTGPFIRGAIPERFVEVDAARLLIILAGFAVDRAALPEDPPCLPLRQFARHFTPEYYLQKLDFLLRYPTYFAYELIELYRLGVPSAANGTAIKRTIRAIIAGQEPRLRTQPFRKFWRGAYERIDDVEAWWHARSLVYVAFQPRGLNPPQKHYLQLLSAFCARNGAVESGCAMGWLARAGLGLGWYRKDGDARG